MCILAETLSTVKTNLRAAAGMCNRSKGVFLRSKEWGLCKTTKDDFKGRLRAARFIGARVAVVTQEDGFLILETVE